MRLKSLKYFFIGLFFWFAGLLFAGSAQHFVKQSEPAKLIVLELQPKTGDFLTMYRPVFGLDTKTRPRPEYAGNSWVWPKPHVLGEIVEGRYDPQSGKMNSDKMISRSLWTGRFAQILAAICAVQGLLMLLFGVREDRLLLRLRLG